MDSGLALRFAAAPRNDAAGNRSGTWVTHFAVE
jgi:hypothetical protein